ncbi:MAG: DinB family protein [Actinomycetia bacterium]|nr:DinB family protein [Actinomycetes bacterium]
MINDSTPSSYSPTWNGDTRTTPPAVGDEREILTSFLDWHRATFELTCAGISPER